MLESQLLLFEFASSVTPLDNLLDTVEDLALVTGLQPLKRLGFEFQLFNFEHIVSLEPVLEVLCLLALLVYFSLDFCEFVGGFHLLQNFVSMQPFLLLFLQLFLSVLVKPSIVPFHSIVVLDLPLPSSKCLLHFL